MRYELPPDPYTLPEEYDPTQYGEFGPYVEPNPYEATLPPMLEPGALNPPEPVMEQYLRAGEPVQRPLSRAGILPGMGESSPRFALDFEPTPMDPATAANPGAPFVKGEEFLPAMGRLLNVAGSAAPPIAAAPFVFTGNAPTVARLAAGALGGDVIDAGDAAVRATGAAARGVADAMPDLLGDSRMAQRGQVPVNPLSEMGQGAQKATVAGAEYDFVRANPDGTAVLRSEGGEFTTDPGEAWSLIEGAKPRTPGWGASTETEYVANQVAGMKAARREMVQEAAAALEDYAERNKLTGPVGASRVNIALTAPRPNKELRGLIASYTNAKSAYDTPLDDVADFARRSWQQGHPTPPRVPDVGPVGEPPVPAATAGSRTLPTEEEVERNVRTALERRFPQYAQPPVEPPPDIPVPPRSAAEAADLAKERGFARTVRESDETSDAVRDVLEDTPRTYQPITIRDTFEQSAFEVDADPYKATLKFLDDTTEWDANKSSIGQVLIRKADAAGEYDLALRYADHLAERATTAGQANAVIAGFDQLSPEGVLRYAQRLVKRAQDIDPKVKAKLTPEMAGKILKRREAIAGLPEGRERLLQQHELMRDIGNLVPPTFWERLGLYQTFSMLSSPRTIVRNVTGNTLNNTILRGADSALQNTFDRALSLRTKQRTTANTLGGYKAGAAGLVKGAREGFEEVGRGVNLGGPGQFELPQPRFTGDSVQMAGIRPFEFFEKYLGYVLRVPDRMQYQGAFDKNLYDLATVKAINEGLSGAERGARVLDLVRNPTKDLTKAATAQASADVFQDDNYLSGLFSLLKSAGNTAGRGKVVSHLGRMPVYEFGMGDILLKFARTPGSLLYQGLKYSPLSWGAALKNTAEVLATGSPAKQKAAVTSLSAAVIGTGLSTFGATMTDAGVMNVEGQTDKKLTELLQAQGVPVKYSFNWDAFGRWLSEGGKPQSYQKGDHVFAYDWLLPFSIPMSMGGRIVEGHKKSLKEARETMQVDKGVLDQIADNVIVDMGSIPIRVLASGIDTIAVQPMLQGMKRLFGGASPGEALVDIALSAPATLVPSIAAAVARMSDTSVRETYSPDDAVQSMNYIISRIPGMAASLPVKRDVFGEPVKRANDPWNVLLNPANSGEYFPRPEVEMLVELRKASEQATEAMPTQVPKSIVVKGANGKPVEVTLSAKEWIDYQQVYGALVNRTYANLAENQAFRNSPVEEQIKTLSSISTALKLEATEELRKRSSEVGGGVTTAFSLTDPAKGKEGQRVTAENAEQWAKDRPLLEKVDKAAAHIDEQTKAFAEVKAQWDALSGKDRDEFERKSKVWQLREKTVEKYRDGLKKDKETRDALFRWRGEGAPPKATATLGPAAPTLSPSMQKAVEDARRLADRYLR